MLLALAAQAVAQQYKPSARDRCFTLGSVQIGPERGSGASPLLHELAPQAAEAVSLCEKTVADHPKEARLYALLARVRAVAGDHKGALEAARTGAELGSVNARVLYGVMLAEGQHVARDYAAAREQFQRAAKEGSPYARYNLGAMLANGWGVQADEPDAAASFRQAAQAGDPLAMQLLGQRYDKAQAEHWFRRAAELMRPEGVREPLRVTGITLDTVALLEWYLSKARGGEAWAQAYVGALAESGQWVQRDESIALAWYRAAGSAGNVPAQWRVARFYNDGRGGVAKDPAEARRWGQMHEVKRCEEHERAQAAADACDRFAADRHDPQSVSPGVDSFCMRHFAPRAIEACTVAVKGAPATPRFRTQLARAYAHTGRFDEARREADAGAKAGATASMTLLGVMAQRGLGVEKNEAAALAWYRKAAEAGDRRAMNIVTTNVYNGIGIAKDSPEARALAQDMMQRTSAIASAAPAPAQMAERGDPRQQFNLAARLEQERKYDEAIQWYTRAAAQDFRPAELNLAQMYEKGIGVKQDTAEARKRYRRLSELGDNEARYRAAKLAAADADWKEALPLYERLARDDDWRALLDLGQLHEDGRGVPKNVARAAELYERAAERSAWARARLGILYLESKDFPKARHWLQRSANDGNGAARNNLGLMHERGLGGKVDYRAARDLYFRALEVGNPEAMGNLENLFASGRGVPSGAAALEWYQRGAEIGLPSAQYRLGRIYAKGEGVPRNEPLAAVHLQNAAQQGHVEARKEAAELFYKMGMDQEAAALGHDGAAKRLAAKLDGKGYPGSREDLRRYLAQPREFPPPPKFASGISRDAGPDQGRAMTVRVGAVAIAQGAAHDAGQSNVWDIIRWFPETDGRKK